jgi:hypothetical protein
VTSSHLQYVLHGNQPYFFVGYDRICYTGSDAGGDNWGDPGFEPEPSAQNAEEALDSMPEGTCYTVVRADLSHDWWALQVDEVQEVEKPLVRTLRDYPSVWLCLDKTAHDNRLSAYDVRVARANRRLNLPRTLTPETDGKIRAVYLWPPSLDGEPYEVTSYSIQPRE